MKSLLREPVYAGLGLLGTGEQSIDQLGLWRTCSYPL
jgi:hypothetical protein